MNKLKLRPLDVILQAKRLGEKSTRRQKNSQVSHQTSLSLPLSISHSFLFRPAKHLKLYCLILLLGLSPKLSYLQITLTVWPGDTNNDSIVNVRDVLPIGLAFNSDVLPREDMSIDWSPKMAFADPTQVLPNTQVNFAHINSNGDFIVNELDLDAVVLNYDSIVAEDRPPLWAPPLIAEVPYCPELQVIFDRDTAFVGDTVFADIILDIPFDGPLPTELGILGLSFSLQYETISVVDTATVVIPDTGPEMLLFVTATPQQVQGFRSVPAGQIDIGAVARGQNAILETRRIAQVGIIVEDMIFRSTEETPFWIDIIPESVLIINDREEAIRFCMSPPDTILLFDPINSVRPAAADIPWNIFPNPTNGLLQLELPSPAQGLWLFDMQGRLQWSTALPMLRQVTTQLPDLPTGVYLLAVEMDGYRLYKKLVVRL